MSSKSREEHYRLWNIDEGQTKSEREADSRLLDDAYRRLTVSGANPHTRVLYGLLKHVGDLIDHDTYQYDAKIRLLMILTEQMRTLEELTPEKVEETVEAIRQKLLDLIEEAKDK